MSAKWAKKFKVVWLPAGVPLTQRAALWGRDPGDQHDAQSRADEMNAGETSPGAWSWQRVGYKIAQGYWAIIEDLEPETNEYGDVSP